MLEGKAQWTKSRYSSNQNVLGLIMKNIDDDNNIIKEFAYFAYPNLVYLELDNVGITEFPQWIFKLKNLHILIIRNNPIEVIPAEINTLEELRILDLSNNAINEMPILRLAKLTTLNLTYNNLDSLDIREYSCLMEYYIGYNNFHSLRFAYDTIESAIQKGRNGYMPMKICMCDFKSNESIPEHFSYNPSFSIEFVHLENTMYEKGSNAYSNNNLERYQCDYVTYPRKNDTYKCGCQLIKCELDRLFYYANFPDPTIASNQFKFAKKVYTPQKYR